MEPKDWFPGAVDSITRQPDNFIAMSTVGDLSYSPNENQRSLDAAQAAATGRRSWKTLKGKPEAVWPPQLEAALIEALQEYQKLDARPTTSKHGVRYPMRNRFISDHILEKTGKMRTAKQVGSRLQQLRDTCKDENLFNLIGRHSGQDQHEFKSEYSPSTRELSPSPPPSSINVESVVVYLQVEVPGRLDVGCSLPQIHFAPNDMQSPYPVVLTPNTSSTSLARYHHYSAHVPTLRHFSNMVEVISRWPLDNETHWTVWLNSTEIHHEVSYIRPDTSMVRASGLAYLCDMVPKFWDKLCDQYDPNDITLMQKVRSASSSTSASSSSLAGAMPPSVKEISLIYHFNIDDKPRSNHKQTHGSGLYLPHPSSQPSPSSSSGRSSSYSSSSSARYGNYDLHPPSTHWQSGQQDSFNIDASDYSKELAYARPGQSTHANPTIPRQMPPPVDSSHFGLSPAPYGAGQTQACYTASHSLAYPLDGVQSQSPSLYPISGHGTAGWDSSMNGLSRRNHLGYGLPQTFCQ